MPAFQLFPYGDGHWMAQWEAEEEFLEILPSLQSAKPSFVDELVPGFQSVLFVCGQNRTDPTSLTAWIEELSSPSSGQDAGRKHRIPVRYHGEDLEHVAKATGLRVAEVIDRHCRPVYTVRLLGFSPGFPYLSPLDPKLHLPRRDEPRPRIAAGSVAIGGSHTGIYSVDSPGGWHILGHTDQALYFPESAASNHPDPREVFRLQAGDQLIFEPR
jgi:KipI family sensor histidine kinase inhibitor